MFNKFMREYGFFVVTTVVVGVVFAVGFVFGRYGKAAPSLEVIEQVQYQSEAPPEKVESTEPVEDTETVEDTEERPQYYEMTVNATAYCPCESCSEGYGRMTATGVYAEAGRTIAVDPTVIPYGSEVIINGHTYIAEDCGGAIKGNDVDIFFDTHEEVSEFGRQTLTAYVLK